MSILIDKVRICNFRSLKNSKIDLSPVTLLIGANNSGKTSFLRALNMVLGVGFRRIVREDFYIDHDDDVGKEKEIIIDIRIIPIDKDYKRLESFDDSWREKQFGELISIDKDDKEFFAFRTKIFYSFVKGDYVTKRYKIKEWEEEPDWEKQKHLEELKQYFDGFPLFFIDAQRDIIQDLRDRNSYFGRLVSKIKVDDELLKEIEGKIKEINENIVANSDELEFLKQELEKLKNTIGTKNVIEISPVNKKLRDINRGININLQDSESESFPLDYHGMGTRSWASLLTFGAFISWQYKKNESDNEPYHTLLALEEPEAHLHPHAQRTLYKQLSELKGQKIISTHSPFISAQCQLNEICHFKKQANGTEIKHLITSGLTAEDQRKLRREVLNTRGELLFARVVVLFEGETEEQAIPRFAEKYWGRHPHEMGISFIGVGGDGNYTPFLRLLQAFEIKWYIFSDGGVKSIDRVKKSLESISGSYDNVITIPDNLNMESYLLREGYQAEIKKAILDFKKANGEIYNANHMEAKEREVNSMADADLLAFMTAYKTKLSPYYATNITSIPNSRSIPPIILKLFEAISTEFNEVRS